MDISLAAFQIAGENFSTTTTTSTTTERATETAMEENSAKPEIPQSNDSVQYIFVPLAVFITVIILSAMVYLMARTKRKIISRIYKRVRSQSDYTMLDASDVDHEDDNEDDPNECLLAGKLQIENRYDTYPIHSYNYSQRELYT